MKQDLIVIIDLGGEDNPGLARLIRSFGVYSEVLPHDVTQEEIYGKKNIKGIILYGGANRIVDGVPIDVPQWIYEINAQNTMFSGVGDNAAKIPVLSFNHENKNGNPSVEITDDSIQMPPKNILEDFALKNCKAERNWNVKNFVDDQVREIRNLVGEKKVLLALSGGVDSSVVAALLIRALGGQQVFCVHVDHGLMRKNESARVESVFRPMLRDNLIHINATDRFLDKLSGISDPEAKRKIIGNEFIRIFEEEARKLHGIEFLAQGTIYPDIVESGTKTSKTIKSHHNVGGLPKDMNLNLIEPLRFLFKDEVRECGIELGLPKEMVYRQPFPGPGLGVRCLGSITRERLEILRESDAILQEEFVNFGLDRKVWQYFTVVPEFKSVGKRDGKRSYEYPVILRAVNSVDAMTAEIEKIDWSVLQRIVNRILDEVPGVNRVLYDLTAKPPGTIEWE